jgi:hypothetical protein
MARHIERMGEMRNAYRVLVHKPDRQSRLFFDKLGNHQLFKEYPVPWNEYVNLTGRDHLGD